MSCVQWKLAAGCVYVRRILTTISQERDSNILSLGYRYSKFRSDQRSYSVEKLPFSTARLRAVVRGKNCQSLAKDNNEDGLLDVWAGRTGDFDVRLQHILVALKSFSMFPY